ncbi:glycosyltransferase family 4 protein [Akkermansia sp. N21116]|uniref:glycosyltransferase family 4 protein n=1 Tax=Akkermansia sp. N21116 TaxID=3040764 RepID=UPI00244EB24A|nr:glycosyltransferase family 4 protein [Akkermansia sp. N21116]WPX41443.1 glycosyltransferase family 4 protein [Akkermansia sp. N21116]
MKILIIGQNSKIANVFCHFATVTMVIDKNIELCRKYSRNTKFTVIESMTDIRNARSIPKRTRELQNWLKEFTPDIVFSNDKYSMIAARFATAFKAKRPLLISTSHSSYSWTAPKRIRQFAFAVKLCTDGYVALASFVYQHLINNGLNPQRLLLQPNTIEYDVFPIKNSYALNDVPQLIYTAVIYPQKGQLILVEAVKILIEKHFVLHVDFIGDFMDEGYKSQIEAYIKRYNLDDYISFRGRIENSVLLNLLPSYDIYVSPSLIEMSPFNLLEAKAAGLPVVACKTGGIPDIISDKTDGLLVPPNDVKSLADSIEELLNSENLRERLGKTARYNISNTQTPEVVANKMQDFFYRINSL